MGTHPIFESDFDCLTDYLQMSDNEEAQKAEEQLSENEKEESKLDNLLSRNYYSLTPANDLNPSDENSIIPVTELGFTADEESFMDQGEGKLKITVGNPEKSQTPMESFITYEVKTETDRIEYSVQQSTIRRRYQDFVWLKTKFEENHPGCIIPPLPSKQAVKGVLDRFSVEFVTKRCSGLNKFLSRVAEHPKLTKSKALKSFLTLSSTDFTIMRKNDTGGVASRLLGLKTIQLSSPKNIKPEWASLLERQDQLSHKMKLLETNTEKLSFETIQFKEDLDQILPTLNNWEKAEQKEEFTQAISKLRETSANCSTCCEKFSQELNDEVSPSFREYGLYCDSIKGLLKRRDAHQVEHESFGDIVQSKQADETSVRLGKFSISGLISGNTEQAKQERLAKLEVEIREFQAATSIAAENLEKLEAASKQEFERYEYNRAIDLAEAFHKLAARTAVYHEESANAWRSATSVDLGE